MLLYLLKRADRFTDNNLHDLSHLSEARAKKFTLILKKMYWNKKVCLPKRKLNTTG